MYNDSKIQMLIVTLLNINSCVRNRSQMVIFQTLLTLSITNCISSIEASQPFNVFLKRLFQFKTKTSKEYGHHISYLHFIITKLTAFRGIIFRQTATFKANFVS